MHVVSVMCAVMYGVCCGMCTVCMIYVRSLSMMSVQCLCGVCGVCVMYLNVMVV